MCQTSGLNIVNNFFNLLIADSTLLSYLNLTAGSTMAEKVKKIQREIDPIGLAVENLPLITIYAIPGVRNKLNTSVYDAMIEVGIYSNSSTEGKSASTNAGTLVIEEKVIALLHKSLINGPNLQVEYQTSFSGSSGIPGIMKCIARFKVGEVIS